MTKRYPGVTALHHVDLRVEAGSVHALIGQNGVDVPVSLVTRDSLVAEGRARAE